MNKKKIIASITILLILVNITITTISPALNFKQVISENNSNLLKINSFLNNRILFSASIQWDVLLTLNPTSGSGDTVIFGEASDANDGPPADIYDTPHAPAPPMPYIYAYFNGSCQHFSYF